MKKLFTILAACLCVSSMWGATYTKVTATPSNGDWSGQYLIVYEASETSALVMNGHLNTTTGSKLDNSKNYVTKTIANNSITLSDGDNNCYFTISKSTTNGKFYIKTASGFYMGRSANSNGMNLDASTKYDNTITYNSTSNYVDIMGSGSTATFLRYNTTSGQERFRYFTGATGTGTGAAIQLYKEVPSGPSITTQPQSATYEQNQSASALTVAATASAGTLSFQWYSNNTNKNTDGTSLGASAQTASYTPSTTSVGTTYYYCVVTDDNGSTASNCAKIEVTAISEHYYINCTAPVGGSYTVQVGSQGAETVTEANVFEAAENQIITLTTTANPGYKLASTPFVVKKVSDQTEVNVSKDGDNYTFEMPAEEVTITANYSKTYTITAGSCTNGAITKIADKDGNAITETSQNSKVVVTTTPSAGYILDELYFVKENEETHNTITNGSFTMVASNVTVYATFKAAIKGFEDVLAIFKGTGTASDDGKQYMLKAEYDALSDAQKDTKYIPLENVSAVFESGASYFSGVTATNNISPARTNNGESLGVKVGASSKAGSIALTLTNTKVLQSIVVRAAMYGKDEGGDGFTIILNEGTSSVVSKSFTLSAGNKILEDCTFYLEENYTVSSIKILQNKASSGRFYMQSIQFNVPSVSLSVTTAQYATYYNATSAYIMPEGLEGITVEGVNGSTLTLNNTHYAAGSVVPAGEALVLHATEELAEATEFTLYAGTATSEKVAENMLKGTSTADEMTTGNVGDVFYRLSQHDSKVGFYYGAADGAAFKPGANKAYLALNVPGAPARFIFGQQDVPTELQNVSAEAVSRKVMIDGRLYILRDGNLFDLNGRLVK